MLSYACSNCLQAFKWTEIKLKQVCGVKKSGLNHCSSPLLEQAKQAKPDWEHCPLFQPAIRIPKVEIETSEGFPDGIKVRQLTTSG
jgi:hypothetical protein